VLENNVSPRHTYRSAIGSTGASQLEHVKNIDLAQKIDPLTPLP